MFTFWLFFHILAAILGFGPLFVFPLVGILASKNPGHGKFASALNNAIFKRLVLPFAGSMLISGIGLIFAAHINLAKTKWLGAAMVLYFIALGLGVGHQLPVGARIAKMANEAPDGQPPPAEMLALIKRQRMVGMISILLFLVILFLMVVKPGGIVGR